MKIFDAANIKEIDNYTIIYEPISSVDLMERASMACAMWIANKVDLSSSIYVFAGSGNNGGDGLAIARLLIYMGFRKVSVFLINSGKKLSMDAEINWKRLTEQGKVMIGTINSIPDFPVIPNETIIIDALFGSGISRPLTDMPASLVEHINSSGCKIISIDLPSGLAVDDSRGFNTVIKANYTLSFQFPKRSFFYSENEYFVGEWHILDIGLHKAFIRNTASNLYYFTEDEAREKLIKRSRFAHKGSFGHALMIAGSFGMAGAAILAAKACTKSGAGLLTTHIPKNLYPLVQQSVPESVYSIDKAGKFFSNLPEKKNFSAAAIGPGIGTSTATLSAFHNFLNSYKDIPLVLDADALNCLAIDKNLIEILPPYCILTPHPGEFDRMFGDSKSSFERNEKQIELAVKYKIIIVLKGAFTSVAIPTGDCYFNSTGNPGMATGGSGDVLTGIILGLLAQKYKAEDAAMLGVFIHGLAGDFANMECGVNALTASDILLYLGKAFLKLENNEE